MSCIVGAGCAVHGDYQPQTYVVRAGDTLYGIAWRHNLDYHDLARWNDLGPGYRIVVGQILSLRPAPYAARRTLPAPPARAVGTPAQPGMLSSPPARAAGAPVWSGLPASPAVAAPPAGGPPPAVDMPPASAPLPPPTASSAMPVPNAQGWVWPTAYSEAPRPVQGGGILFLGQLGQPVRAAYAGHVVYVGNGIRGYGNLIIIKHGESLLTAYAHTRELTVHEGQDVRSGEVIAQMGLGPHRIAALYFEVRLNGKPVDPLPYLQGAR